MDAVRELETSHNLNKWRWLSGAVQHHHTTLVMLLELLKNPYLTGMTQIMKGLDHVFVSPMELTLNPLIRIRYIAVQLRDHMDLCALRDQLNALTESQHSQDVPDLDYLDALTSSSSVTPGNTSPITRTSSRSDDQWAYVASLWPASISVQPSRFNQVSGSSAFPDQLSEPHTNSQRSFIDIDTVSQAPLNPLLIR